MKKTILLTVMLCTQGLMSKTNTIQLRILPGPNAAQAVQKDLQRCLQEHGKKVCPLAVELDMTNIQTIGDILTATEYALADILHNAQPTITEFTSTTLDILSEDPEKTLDVQDKEAFQTHYKVVVE